MKLRAFLLPLAGTALIAGLTSCSQNSGYADAETAQAVAEGTMPPWMAEYSDTVYDSSATTSPYAYNPPPKPKVTGSSTSKKTSSAKKTASRSSSSVTYTVKKGDTLGAIAQRYRRNGHKTSVKGIKQANGLKSDFIKIGQKLKIPREK